MRKLISITDKILIKNGSLVIDQDYGMIITLPSPYDEITDYLKKYSAEFTPK